MKKKIGADKLWFYAVYIVGFAGLTRAEVRSWSMRKREIAFRYMYYVYYSASDNIMKKVKRPSWWNKEWGSWENNRRLENRLSRSKVGSS